VHAAVTQRRERQDALDFATDVSSFEEARAVITPARTSMRMSFTDRKQVEEARGALAMHRANRLISHGIVLSISPGVWPTPSAQGKKAWSAKA
jgi:hypothetical protein